MTFIWLLGHCGLYHSNMFPLLEQIPRKDISCMLSDVASSFTDLLDKQFDKSTRHQALVSLEIQRRASCIPVGETGLQTQNSQC